MRMLCRSVRLGIYRFSRRACGAAPARGGAEVMARPRNLVRDVREYSFANLLQALRSAEWRTHAPGLSRAGGMGLLG